VDVMTKDLGEFHILGYNTMGSGRSSLTFLRSLLPPSSWSVIKPGKPRVSLLAATGVTLWPLDGSSIFLRVVSKLLPDCKASHSVSHSHHHGNPMSRKKNLASAKNQTVVSFY
jgi:hypothetical protein